MPIAYLLYRISRVYTSCLRKRASSGNLRGDRPERTLWNRLSSFVLAAAIVGMATQSVAQQQGTNLDSASPSLAARVDELDQQIRILQRLRELTADSAAAAAKDKVSATASAKDGFSLKSADGKYTLRFRGYMQSD